MAATDRRETESGIEVKPVYTDADAPGELELPGEFPFTRGPYRDMYRGRPWTIRQYAGFASAEETNARFRYLLDRGQTGPSVAFDLPTQLGYDSDDARAVGAVVRPGASRPLAAPLRRTALLLLRRAQRLLPGGGEVPCGAAAVGEDHERAPRRDEPEGAGASLPRPGRRLDTDRAAAAEQGRARR